MEHKMTDNEIIKALECCSSDDANCDDCPANKYCTNDDFCLTGAILDLIKRQKAEIERLKTAESFERNVTKLFDRYKTHIKAEAVKEFAERYERYLLSQLTSASLDKKEWIPDLFFCKNFILIIPYLPRVTFSSFGSLMFGIL